MNHDAYPESYIRDILGSVRTVAIVGASNKEVRPSYFVARYLLDKGYRIFPINPGLAGKTILGQLIHARLHGCARPDRHGRCLPQFRSRCRNRR